MAFDSRDFCPSVSSEGEDNSDFYGIGNRADSHSGWENGIMRITTARPRNTSGAKPLWVCVFLLISAFGTPFE